MLKYLSSISFAHLAFGLPRNPAGPLVHASIFFTTKIRALWKSECTIAESPCKHQRFQACPSVKGMFELISRRGITCWGLEVCSGRLLEASNSRAFKLTKVECRPCIPPTTHGYQKSWLHKLRQSPGETLFLVWKTRKRRFWPRFWGRVNMWYK